MDCKSWRRSLEAKQIADTVMLVYWERTKHTTKHLHSGTFVLNAKNLCGSPPGGNDGWHMADSKSCVKPTADRNNLRLIKRVTLTL